MSTHVLICRKLFAHEVMRAFSLAWLNAGNNNAAKIAMIAITTKSSMSVKLAWRDRRIEPGNCERSWELRDKFMGE